MMQVHPMLSNSRDTDGWVGINSKFHLSFLVRDRNFRNGSLMPSRTIQNLSASVAHYSIEANLKTFILDTFLQINDQINTVLGRYEAFQKGDYKAAANPIPAEVSNAASTVGPNHSLIDFDDFAASANTSGSTGTANDLAGLFATPVAPAANPQMQAHAPVPVSHNNGYGMNLLLGGGGARGTISPPSVSATPPAAIMLPGTPSNNNNNKPNHLGGGQSQGKDPFADLAGLF